MSTIMKDALKMASLAIDGLEVIQSLTHLGGDKAEAALKTIDAIIKSLQDGFTGKTTPDVVAAELSTLRKSIATNDAKADALLKQKFPEG